MVVVSLHSNKKLLRHSYILKKNKVDSFWGIPENDLWPTHTHTRTHSRKGTHYGPKQPLQKSPTWWTSTFLLGLLPGIWVKGYLQGAGMTMLNPIPSLGDGSKQCSPGALRTAHRQFQSLRTPSTSRQSDSLPQQLLPLFRQLARIFVFPDLLFSSRASRASFPHPVWDSEGDAIQQ